MLAAAPPALPQQQPTVKTNVDEVLLDLIVRDKKGKPVTDLKPEEITVTDNGVKQTILSFRLVRGSEAISATGASYPLDPLRQIRLVTLAFEPLSAPDQRKLARSAALDLIKGDQGVNVFYSVVVIDTRLLVLQQFTKDHDALDQGHRAGHRGVERAAAEFGIGCHHGRAEAQPGRPDRERRRSGFEPADRRHADCRRSP